MENVRDIKARIKSVREIYKITRAMKLVATAKQKKLMLKVADTAKYVEKIDDLLLCSGKEVVRRFNPYFTPRHAGGKSLLVVVTADKGLCGSFNANLNRHAANLLAQNPADVYVVGKKGRNFFRKHTEINLIGETVDIFGKTSFRSCNKIMHDLKLKFLSGTYDSISVLYTHFESLGRQTIITKQLLPIVAEPLKPESSDDDTATEPVPKIRRFMYESSADAVFDELIEHYLDLQLYIILLESELSEHITRMNAMDSATQNASDLIDSLVLAYNRVRQAMITTEILEIAGGAEAIKSS